jgi:hypothetical protein
VGGRGRERGGALARVALMASLAVAGCLEKTPGPVHGDVPDSGGLSSEGACPGAGAPSGDAGDDADASDDSGANAEGGAAPDGGPNDDGDAGGDAAGAVTVAAAWAGTWTFVSGGSGVSCPDGISNAGSMGVLVIKESPQGGSLLVSEDACTFHFTLAGDTATSDCGQSCSAWAIPTIPIWTLTLKPDGTLVEHLGGRVPLNGETCTLSGTSKLTRTAQ